MDAMNDGVLEGMQSFDYELERLILAGEVDREVALSYATNRTNLQLRLETQGPGASKTGSIPFKPQEDLRRTGSFGVPDMDDLIER